MSRKQSKSGSESKRKKSYKPGDTIVHRDNKGGVQRLVPIDWSTMPLHNFVVGDTGTAACSACGMGETSAWRTLSGRDPGRCLINAKEMRWVETMLEHMMKKSDGTSSNMILSIISEEAEGLAEGFRSPEHPVVRAKARVIAFYKRWIAPDENGILTDIVTMIVGDPRFWVVNVIDPKRFH